MYKILIKYSSANSLISNLWQVYGSTTTTSTSDSDTSTVTFTEFETDDVAKLQEEISKLDKKYGYENIKVIKDVDVTYTATVEDSDNSDSVDNTDDSTDTDSNSTDISTTEDTDNTVETSSETVTE